jgi:histidine triad (HIT) family protein
MYRHAPAGYDCPFCAVVRGEERPPWTFRHDVIWQDGATTAWVNGRWWENNPGNVIVVPNEHIENLYELRRDLAADVHETVRRIALAMKNAYECGGVSTRQHNEPAGDQEVWHYHVHLFPRWEGDDLYRSAYRLTRPEERHPYAERLRAALRLRPCRRSGT